MSVSNPFRILIVIAAVIAVAFFVGFIFVVFVQNGGRASALAPIVTALRTL